MENPGILGRIQIVERFIPVEYSPSAVLTIYLPLICPQLQVPGYFRFIPVEYSPSVVLTIYLPLICPQLRVPGYLRVKQHAKPKVAV